MSTLLHLPFFSSTIILGEKNYLKGKKLLLFNSYIFFFHNITLKALKLFWINNIWRYLLNVYLKGKKIIVDEKKIFFNLKFVFFFNCYFLGTIILLSSFKFFVLLLECKLTWINIMNKFSKTWTSDFIIILFKS